ncbi:MAG: hypothetical protein IT456_01035 [Planctomycetes bacterium]|nr:hypothetical protein [Planctomycetota bacterium]
MTAKRVCLSPLVGLMLVGVCAAQRQVLTVGGSNATHTDLPAAVAAAAPGAVVQVRPGNYTGFSTNKALRIVLDFTATTGSVSAPAGSAYAIEINGLPAGQQFALVGRGAAIGAGSLGAIRIANVGGSVVLDRLSVAVGSAHSGIDVQNSANVLVQNASIAGAPALQVQDAVVVGSSVAWSSPVGVGIVALRGNLEFGLGSMAGYRAPALRVLDSVVRLAGNGSTAIRVTGNPPQAVAAIEAIQSDVRWLPANFVVQPGGSGPALLGVGGQVITEEVPALVASCGPPGGLMAASMTRPSPAPGIVVLGNLVLSHVAFGLPGVFWDQSGPAVVLAVGPVDATGLSFQTTWPNVPWLLGELFCCQGVVIQPNGALLTSGAATWTAL